MAWQQEGKEIALIRKAESSGIIEVLFPGFLIHSLPRYKPTFICLMPNFFGRFRQKFPGSGPIS